ADFKEIDKNRNDLQKKIRDFEKRVDRQVRADEREMARLRGALKDPYHQLRLHLARIPGCAQTVEFSILTSLPDREGTQHAQELVDRCLEILNQRLSKLRDEDIQQTARLT